MSHKVQVTEIKEDMLNSVELSMNAKGDYSWSIKMYSDYSGMNNIVRDIESIDAQLRRKFRGGSLPVQEVKNPVESGPPVGIPLPEAKKPKKEEARTRVTVTENPPKPSRKVVEEPEEEDEPEEFDFEFEEEEEEEAPPPPPKRTRRSRK